VPGFQALLDFGDFCPNAVRVSLRQYSPRGKVAPQCRFFVSLRMLEPERALQLLRASYFAMMGR